MCTHKSNIAQSIDDNIKRRRTLVTALIFTFMAIGISVVITHMLYRIKKMFFDARRRHNDCQKRDLQVSRKFSFFFLKGWFVNDCAVETEISF